MWENEELFTTRMKKATRKLHTMSDALVNAKFAISLRDDTVWSGGLFAFYHIFAFLEDAKQRLNMPEYDRMFVNNAMYRKEAFEDDLKYYFGNNWRSLRKSKALENYLEHLDYLENENPRILLAYVYHLYLGLLSGGQLLASKRRMFGITNSRGEQYVDKVTDFSAIEMSKLKMDLRHAMNMVSEHLTEDEKEAIVEESKQVFLMNNLIVDSVGGQGQALFNIFYKASAIVLALFGVVLAYKLFK